MSQHRPSRPQGSPLRHLRGRSEIILTPLLLVAVGLVWQLGARGMGIPGYVLPLPTEIWEALKQQVASDITWSHVRVTATEAGLGFLIAIGLTLLVAVLVALVPWFESLVMPYLIALQTVPTVALAPLLLVWLGFESGSKIAMAAVTAFFPIMLNTLEGLRANAKERIEMVSAFGASSGQVLRLVRVPTALPAIFAGLDIGIVFALLGAVVGEFAGARAGLGYLVLQASYGFDIPGMFAYLMLLAGMGLVGHFVIVALRRRVVFWERVPR